jgi:RIO kinase 1
MGVIDEVVRPLMSGKEAKVYLVRVEGETRIAKVYKDAANRSFHQRADYTEGRRVRNSRTQRAMTKRSKFGRDEVESAWRSAEVDAIHRLRRAGVRVPEAYDFVEGVLVMELVHDGTGEPAPRLVDVTLRRDEAIALHDLLLREIVKMLCAGVIHGDLSEFNILVGADGPVIIDLPQAVDAAGNNHARAMLERDVGNLVVYFGQFAPELLATRYGKEIWHLYEHGELHPDTPLTGRFTESNKPVDLRGVMREIDDAIVEERERRLRMQEAE